jgi:hypothetical protein
VWPMHRRAYVRASQVRKTKRNQIKKCRARESKPRRRGQSALSNKRERGSLPERPNHGGQSQTEAHGGTQKTQQNKYYPTWKILYHVKVGTSQRQYNRKGAAVAVQQPLPQRLVGKPLLTRQIMLLSQHEAPKQMVGGTSCQAHLEVVQLG